MSAKDDFFVSPLDGIVSPEVLQRGQQLQSEEAEASEQFFTPIQSTPGGSLQSQSFLSCFNTISNQNISSETPQLFQQQTSYNNNNISSETPQIFQNNSGNIFNNNNKDNKQQAWQQFVKGQIPDSIEILQKRKNDQRKKSNNNDDFMNMYDDMVQQLNQDQQYLQQQKQAQQQIPNLNNLEENQSSFFNEEQREGQKYFEASLFRGEYSQQQQPSLHHQHQRSLPMKFHQVQQNVDVIDEDFFEQNQHIMSKHSLQNLDNSSMPASLLFDSGVDSSRQNQSILRLPDNIQIHEESKSNSKKDIADIFLGIQQQQYQQQQQQQSEQLVGDQNVESSNVQSMSVDCENDDDDDEDFKCAGAYVLFSPEQLSQQKQTQLMDMYEQQMQRIRGLQKQAEKNSGQADTDDPYQNLLCHMLKNQNEQTSLPKNLPSPVPATYQESPQQGVNLNIMKTPQKQIKAFPLKKSGRGTASPGIPSLIQKNNIMATPIELRKMVQAVEEAVENLEINSGDAEEKKGSGKSDKLEEWLEELGLVGCIGQHAKDKLFEVWQGLDEAEKLRSTLEQLKQAELELAAESQKEFDRRVQVLHEENVGLEKQNEHLRKQIERLSGQEADDNKQKKLMHELQLQQKEDDDESYEQEADDNKQKELMHELQLQQKEDDDESYESCEFDGVENTSTPSPTPTPSPSIGLLSEHLRSAADTAAGILSVLGQRKAPEDPQPIPPQPQTPPPKYQTIETQTSVKKETPFHIDSLKKEQDSVPSFQGSSSKDKCTKSFIETHKQNSQQLQNLFNRGLPGFQPWGSLRHKTTTVTAKGEKHQPYSSLFKHKLKNTLLKSKYKGKTEVDNQDPSSKRKNLQNLKYQFQLKEKSYNNKSNLKSQKLNQGYGEISELQDQQNGFFKKCNLSNQSKNQQQGQTEGSILGQKQQEEKKSGKSQLHQDGTNLQVKYDKKQVQKQEFLGVGNRPPAVQSNNTNLSNNKDNTKDEQKQKIFKQHQFQKQLTKQQFEQSLYQLQNQSGQLDQYQLQNQSGQVDGIEQPPLQNNMNVLSTQQNLRQKKENKQEGNSKFEGQVQGGVEMYQQGQGYQGNRQQLFQGKMSSRPEYYNNAFYNQVQQGGIPNNNWLAAQVMQPFQQYPQQVYPLHAPQFYSNYPVLQRPPPYLYTHPHHYPPQLPQHQIIDPCLEGQPIEWSRRGLPEGIVKAVDEALADINASKDYEYVLQPIKKVNKIKIKNQHQRDLSEQSFFDEKRSAKQSDEQEREKGTDEQQLQQENIKQKNSGIKDRKKKRSTVLRKAGVLGIKLDDN